MAKRPFASSWCFSLDRAEWKRRSFLVCSTLKNENMGRENNDIKVDLSCPFCPQKSCWSSSLNPVCNRDPGQGKWCSFLKEIIPLVQFLWWTWKRKFKKSFGDHPKLLMKQLLEECGRHWWPRRSVPGPLFSSSLSPQMSHKILQMSPSKPFRKGTQWKRIGLDPMDPFSSGARNLPLKQMKSSGIEEDSLHQRKAAALAEQIHEVHSVMWH